MESLLVIMLPEPSGKSTSVRKFKLLVDHLQLQESSLITHTHSPHSHSHTLSTSSLSLLTLIHTPSLHPLSLLLYTYLCESPFLYQQR